MGYFLFGPRRDIYMFLDVRYLTLFVGEGEWSEQVLGSLVPVLDLKFRDPLLNTPSVLSALKSPPLRRM